MRLGLFRVFYDFYYFPALTDYDLVAFNISSFLISLSLLMKFNLFLEEQMKINLMSKNKGKLIRCEKIGHFSSLIQEAFFDK